eukprot:10217832-Alexandrium_andersonii.AAC.1
MPVLIPLSAHLHPCDTWRALQAALPPVAGFCVCRAGSRAHCACVRPGRFCKGHVRVLTLAMKLRARRPL